MPILTNAPLPFGDPIATPRDRQRYAAGQKDPREGRVPKAWQEALSNLRDVTEASAARLNSVSLTGQTASLAATDFTGGALPAGLYRIDYYAAITRAAGTSSSLTVTFDWTDGSVSKTVSGAAIVDGTNSAVQTGPPHLIRIDSASPVRYSTTYVSVGAPTLEYKLYAVLSKIDA